MALRGRGRGTTRIWGATWARAGEEALMPRWKSKRCSVEKTPRIRGIEGVIR